MWRAVVSQPLDRSQETKQFGGLDTEAGEFFVAKPFRMPQLGHNLSAFEVNRLFLNLDGRRFLDGSFAANANIDSDSRSVVAGDMDADGDVDLLVGSVGGGPLRMFMNQFSSGYHRTRIELVGKQSNRLAIGARVVLRSGSTTITRDLFPQNGFMGQAPAELLIGLGSAATIDRLTVRWPNGLVQEFSELPVDHRIKIHEGDAGYQLLSL